MSIDPDYDERTCITAGELRAAGVQVPPEIPDVGWVPRESIQWQTVKGTIAKDTLGMTMTVEFGEPFRWIDVKVRVDP